MRLEYCCEKIGSRWSSRNVQADGAVGMCQPEKHFENVSGLNCKKGCLKVLVDGTYNQMSRIKIRR